MVMSSYGVVGRQSHQVLFRCCAASLPTRLSLRSVLSLCFMLVLCIVLYSVACSHIVTVQPFGCNMIGYSFIHNYVALPDC